MTTQLILSSEQVPDLFMGDYCPVVDGKPWTMFHVAYRTDNPPPGKWCAGIRVAVFVGVTNVAFWNVAPDEVARVLGTQAAQPKKPDFYMSVEDLPDGGVLLTRV
jgi:hypothetical protein